MSTTSSSSKGGGGGDSRRRQKQANRGAKNIKDQPKPLKQDKLTETPDEIPDETPNGIPKTLDEAPNEIPQTLEEAGDTKNTCKDLVVSPANEIRNPKDGNMKSPEASYDGDNWEPVYTGKILKRGRKKPEAHDLPPLQIPGVINPHKDKIARDNKAALSQEEFNADIAERIQRGRGGEIPTGMTQGTQKNPLVAFFENESTDHFSAEWRKRPEVPTTEELLRDVVNLPTNLIDGSYDSVDEYLETHYSLLREDAFAGLRDAVLLMKDNPESLDTHDVSIYENVRVLGLTFSKLGVASKVSFSTNRAGKKIPWKHSKRLIPGTLVCLSDDGFRTVKVATVAARPMCGLEINPPEVDLFFHETELEIDTEKVFLMIESRNGYYEAYKWTLRTLQRMTEDNFPLHEHICFLNQNVPPPDYVKKKPFLNLSPIFPDIPDKEALEDVDIINAWPQDVRTTMDHTQMVALKSILTRRVSIVQGPPGTGKTFVSVRALEILLHNMDTGDPPIIVACQTNHALDQLLNHVLKFEDEIVRMGGRTQDKDKIKEHTIFELRKKSNVKITGSQHGYASTNIKRIKEKMMKLFESLKQEVLTPDDFYDHGLISAQQAKSFTERSAGWIIAEENDIPGGIMGQWLGELFREIQVQDIIDGEYEEGDIDEEKRKEIEQDFLLSGPALGDKIDDRLKGEWFAMGRQYTVDKPVGVTVAEIQQARRVRNVWDLEGYMRGALYHQLRKEFIDKVWKEVKSLNQDYQRYCHIMKISNLEKDAHIISTSKLVGMTTTGLGKYRSIIAAVNPKVVLIEEAAEALEGPVVIACMPSVEHLILVGDHKQLRGHCSDTNLSDEPYYLDISMFERLVTNELPFETLKTQRRMRPEIREILKPIYEDTLVDHESVLGRESIPGMGDTSVYWYTHYSPETTDDVHSRVNVNEAQMIVNFADYLVLNGMKPEDITILTFYAGQRTEILKVIRKNTNIANADLKVKTVDSYQGEENEVILLSLVRSNGYNQIGFLEIANRVCVALSRARRGLYIFGNATIITQASKLWWEVGSILNEPPSRIGISLPLTCQKHKSRMTIEDPMDWIDINGGCRKWCKEILPCNHNCILRCHPFGHDDIRCTFPCEKILSCNHQCSHQCWQDCACQKCGNKSEKPPPLPPPAHSSNQNLGAIPAIPAIPTIPSTVSTENRQIERSFSRSENASRPQTATPKLVEIDEWEAALPMNQLQITAIDRGVFPDMVRGQTTPFDDYNKSNRSHPQSDYPQKDHQGNRPRGDYLQNNYPQSDYHQENRHQNRPQNSRLQNNYQDGHPQDNHLQNNHQGSRPQSSHPPDNYSSNYPPNGYAQVQNNHRPNSYSEADHYNGNNPSPNINNPNIPIRGGGGVYGNPRRQLKEQWPDDDDENRQAIDDRSRMGRGYNQWNNRRGYPAQDHREEWPSLGRGNTNNTPRSQDPMQRGVSNAWDRNNAQNHGPPRDGPSRGDRGQGSRGNRGRNFIPYTDYR